jgi:UBA/TS-N domain
MDMGFPEPAVRGALLETKGDENAAVEKLLSTL